MGVKQWFRKFQPIQLYVILALTITFFLTELIVSHLTHALTLLMDSYHMLCNIIALSGCIVTIKYSEESADCDLKNTQSIESNLDEKVSKSRSNQCQDKKNSPKVGRNEERKLKNTFGWARIDVIIMLICCVFMASLSFSIFVEALQTLIHIGHQDEMHRPITVLCTGAAGLLLNGICYLLIGGYTFHQGSFLYVTESGDVVLSKVVVDQTVQRGARRLSRSKTIHPTALPPKQRQGIWEMTRDVHGCILVIICALLIFFTDKNVAKYIDPIISLISAASIMVLSYPYMRESGLILLQTIPDTIDINILKAELLNQFPDIVNIHDFHIWQLSANKIVSTVHIIFQNPKVYSNVMEEVKEFFKESGITHTTIQPEFFKKDASMDSLRSNKYAPNCLMTCLEDDCKQNHCCPEYEEKGLFKTQSHELFSLPEKAAPTLKSVKILEVELSSQVNSNSNSSINSIRSDNAKENESSSRSEVRQGESYKSEVNVDVIDKAGSGCSNRKVGGENIEQEERLQNIVDIITNDAGDNVETKE
ncbi:unnamed protein product [Phaedon cochleariae]|uniref:Zinc/cadmium resistance protein n=1 Tax=Phaedon cochleariae TaxID=80249 RepID=A0A9P0DT48_PHACE|nr:unnamed protein product [Phaedon cochleariae]